MTPDMRSLVWSVGLQELKEERAEHTERYRRSHRRPKGPAQSNDGAEKASQQISNSSSIEVPMTIEMMKARSDAFRDSGDHEQSIHWLRKAAEAGDVGSQEWLGYIYYNGYDVAQDYAEAARWYEMAAFHNSCTGQYELGLLYLKGRGVEQDFERARLWFEQARVNKWSIVLDGVEIEPHATDRAFSNYELAHLYLNGLGVTRDVERGVELLQTAAEIGCGPALDDLGVLHCDGTLGDPDWKSAVEWFRRGAEERDFWNAQRNLALCYWNGTGVEQSDSLAFQWMKRAASHWVEFSEAYFMMGWFHEDGIGTEQDVPEAVKWYYKAALKDHEEALARLQQRIESLSVVPPKESKE